MKLEEGKKGVVTLSATSCPAKSSARRAPAPDSVGKLPVACTGCSTATQVSTFFPFLTYLLAMRKSPCLPRSNEFSYPSLFLRHCPSSWLLLAGRVQTDPKFWRKLQILPSSKSVIILKLYIYLCNEASFIRFSRACFHKKSTTENFL